MRDYLITGVEHEAVVTAVCIDFPDHELEVDETLRMYRSLAEPFLNGDKRFSTRCRPGKLRIPATDVLPWLETTPRKKYDGKQVGLIRVPRIYVTTVETVTDAEARWVGYYDSEDMILDMSETYNNGEVLQNREAITVYEIIPLQYKKMKFPGAPR